MKKGVVVYPIINSDSLGSTWLWALWLSFIGSLLVVVTSRWHGRFSMDHTHGIQKFHTHPTPRVGGVPIFVSVAALALAWGDTTGMPANAAELLQVLVYSGALAFGFGLLEDLTKRIGVLQRLLATMASGVLAWWLSDVSLTRLGVPVVDSAMAWVPLSVVFTAFAVGGVANALNIVDGFNGLASSTAVWAFLGLAAIAVSEGDAALAQVCVVLAMATLGFFAVNWPAGKLFLGDGGSYFLGFSLAWCAVLLVERNAAVSPFAPLVVCAFPVIEVLFSIFRRRVRHQSPGAPDRLHLHSLLKRRYVRRWLPFSPAWWRNAVTGLVVGGATALCSVLGYVAHHSTVWLALVFAVLFIAYVAVYARMVRQRWCSPLSFLIQVPKQPKPLASR